MRAMKDIKKLTRLLDYLKVEYTMNCADDKSWSVRCTEGSEKVVGHAWFFTEFEFDKKGKFIQMGVWE